jgi:hypothetical protein
MSEVINNNSNTLSINSTPGQDAFSPLIGTTSIFTFGNFRLEQSKLSDNLNNIQKSGNFSSYSNLTSLGSDKFDVTTTVNTTLNELNPKKDNPLSYSYFGSFYSKVAIAINDIIEKFPYAISSYDSGVGTTLYNYTEDPLLTTSSFLIPLSAITNQGNVIYVSGATSTGFTRDIDQITLFDDYTKYAVQLSGASGVHNITSYSYTTGTTGYFNITVEGMVLTGGGSSTTLRVYVRPTNEIFAEFKKTISNLEYQIYFGGELMVPDEDGETFVNETFEWPKTIDGFNPDLSGTDYESFKTDILAAARSIDETKTNIMIRTMIPENYLELDTDSQIYTKLLGVYTSEFDLIKQYIDNLAFAHSVTYTNEESIPNKFIQRLSTLLGLDLVDSFTATDFFEYITGDNPIEQPSPSEYNLELWRKILININWLYKKKGTRDALMFFFKLIGAPDSLIEFNEFTYKVNKVVQDDNNSINVENSKINDYGYINYNASIYAFQEGGAGRGNGQAYIHQWEPEFNLERTVDNIKIYTGSDEYYGTQNILNSKEVQINLSPSNCIEEDVKDWYELGVGWWEWGSTRVPFSGLTVPYEWQINNIRTVANAPYYSGSTLVPSYITGITISQWIDFIYASNVNPRNRKTEGYKIKSRTDIYMNLKKIYMTYMLWTNNEESNRLTHKKLEHFLELLERGFMHYIPQFIPATTILADSGTKYRNPEFLRHRFIYPPGINDGSEFQRALPADLNPNIYPVKVTGIITESIKPVINAVNVLAFNYETISKVINSVNISNLLDTGTNAQINAVSSVMNFNTSVEKTYPVGNGSAPVVMTPITFPEPPIITCSPEIRAIATIYNTHTGGISYSNASEMVFKFNIDLSGVSIYNGQYLTNKIPLTHNKVTDLANILAVSNTNTYGFTVTGEIRLGNFYFTFQAPPNMGDTANWVSPNGIRIYLFYFNSSGNHINEMGSFAGGVNPICS